MRAPLAVLFLLAGCISPEAEPHAQPENDSVADGEGPAFVPSTTPPAPEPAENDTPPGPAGPRVERFETKGEKAALGGDSRPLAIDVFPGAREVRAWLWWNGSADLVLVVDEPGACRLKEGLDELSCTGRPDPKEHTSKGGGAPATVVVAVDASRACADEAGCTWVAQVDAKTTFPAVPYVLVAEVEYPAPTET